MTKAKTNSEEPARPIRRAVIAETGRKLLDRLTINSANGDQSSTTKRKQLNKKKRQLSSRSVAANEPATSKVPKLKVDPDQARKPGVVPKMWSAEEDLLLHDAISKHGERNWRAIADLVPGRSYIQCLQRWKKALRPGLRKGHWTKEEDASLLKLVARDKPDWDWGLISNEIPGRNAKQCRERWFLNLDPSINRGPWSAEEDDQLLNFVAQLGGRWALIAKHMEGRTENSVKTRFHSLQRKEARNRKWSKEEDDLITKLVMKYGREFDKIDSQIKGRTKGQIKKRFSILTQQKPDLIRSVYAVEEALRQKKAAEAMMTTQALQSYPTSFQGSPPRFPSMQRQTSLQRQGSFGTDNLSWITRVADPSNKLGSAKSTLRKSDSARVIHDILQKKQTPETETPNSMRTEDGESSNRLARWQSSGLTRFFSQGGNPNLPLQGISSLSNQSQTQSPPTQDQAKSKSYQKMDMFDRLIDETKSKGIVKPNVSVSALPNKTPYTSQQYPTNPLMYNQANAAAANAAAAATTGIPQQTSSYGVDGSSNLPSYDTSNGVLFSNAMPKRPIQNASNSLGSFGLATYDSSDMKSYLNLL